MSDIPAEIIDDILIRLPVKSLITFRCVSKSWKALIDSPKFIKAHLNRQKLLKPNSDFKLILNGKDGLFSFDFSTISNRKSARPQELDHPLNHLDGPTWILGSCNGLLFIYNNPEDVGLWNPSTKMFRRLPPPPGISIAQFRLGFGYDGSNDDYKVVGIGQWFRPDDGTLVSTTMIYSLKLDMWKKVDQGCLYWLGGKPALAGGVLHWLTSKDPQRPTRILDKSPFTVIGLNLGSERFEELLCPEILDSIFHLTLAVLGECLCLLSSQLTCHTNGKDFVLNRIDIWVMKVYGVKESWIKLFSIQLLDFTHLKPIAYSVNGRDVLLQMDRRNLMWYSLENESLTPVKMSSGLEIFGFNISGGLECFESFLCLGTLVPLYEGNDKKQDVEPDEKTRTKKIDKGYGFLIKGLVETLKQLWRDWRKKQS